MLKVPIIIAPKPKGNLWQRHERVGMQAAAARGLSLVGSGNLPQAG